MTCFIIAEAGVNHNGSQELALRLVEAAATAGADAVKFQTFKAENLVRPGAAKADYQRKQTGDGDQLLMLRELELPESAYAALYSRCQQLGIEFMSTPFDEESTAMLIDTGVKRLKIPSGELTNLPFLEFLTRKNLPLILSTGMGTLEEVREAVEVIRNASEGRGSHVTLGERLTLLHCTSNYPAAVEDVNLRAMHTLRDTFDLPVGYSDHTLGTLIPVAAVAMGAVVLEKHLTLDRNLPGPDHQASLEPKEFCDLVASIRVVEKCLGLPEKKPCPNELPVRDLVRRSVTLKRALKARQQITADDLTLCRPGNGILPKDMDKIVGMRAIADLPAGKTLLWADVMA